MKSFSILKKNKSIFLAISASLLLGAAKPKDGDFVNREAQIWSKDIIGTSLNEYNQILCVFSKLNPEKNIDREAYTAKVNYSACEPGKTASPSDTYLIYTVKAISETDGYSAHIWETAIEKDGQITALNNVGYYKVFVSKKIEKNFKLEGCTATSVSGSDCILKAFIEKQNSRINIHANSRENLAQDIFRFYFHLVADVSEKEGFGSMKDSNIGVSRTSFSGKFQNEIDIDYAYLRDNAVLKINRYQMGNTINPLTDVYPPGNKCINRNENVARKDVFNYELFNADGSRYVINKGQIPYTIIDINGRAITDSSGNQIGGRIMWNDVTNQEGWYLSVSKSIIINRLRSGERLRVITNFASLPNYIMDMRIHPNDPNDFQILDQDGSPYRMSGALPLTFTIRNGINVSDLLDNSLDGTTRTLSYMGNEYIHNIPWDNGFKFNIIEGSSAVGANDGKIYFIRPMFYSVEPIDEVCSPTVLNELTKTSATRALLPENPTYTGSVHPNWRDPRLSLGPVPTTNSNFKYIDGK